MCLTAGPWAGSVLGMGERPKPTGWVRKVIGRLVAAETVYTFWERAEQLWYKVPEPVRRAAAAVARRWIEVVVTLIWLVISALLQHLASLPAWVIWWSSCFTVLLAFALFQWISASRRWRAAAKAREEATSKPPRTPSGKTEKEKALDKIYRDWLRDAHVIIPSLPERMFNILVKLLKSPSYFQKGAEGLGALESKEYIYKHLRIPGKARGTEAVLYELNNNIAEIVAAEYEKRCEDKLASVLAEKDRRYKHTLRFFSANDAPDWPEPMSGEIRMLYWDLRHLQGCGIVEQADMGDGHVSYSIVEVYRSYVTEQVLSRGDSLKGSVSLNLHEVPAQENSGGGGGPPISTPSKL